MANTWIMRLAHAGMLFGGCTLVIILINPNRGTVDANARVKETVAAASAVQVSNPLELALAEVTSVKPVPMVERVRVSGDLQPVNRVVMRAKIAGKILSLDVREGEQVSPGDVLMRFETHDLRSTLLQRESDRDAAEAELVLAEQALNRIEQLSAKNATSKEQLEKAKSDVASNTSKVQSLSAQVDIAKVALRDAEILAPFDGIIATRAVEAGSRVSADAELLTVVDTSIFEAKVLVSTRDIGRVSVGQIAELQIDGMDGQMFKGTVGRINPVADAGTRFVPVYLRLPNHDGKLWGGMFVSSSIRVREKNDALVVPAVSLRKDNAGDYVLKLQTGHLRRQSVTVGQSWSDGNLVEIAAGLKDGDVIVTAPLPELLPDVAVTVNKAG